MDEQLTPTPLKEWSLGVYVEWRPEPRFYDVRGAILERLEKEGLRRAYRVEEDSVGALLTAEYHELQMTDKSAVVRAATRDVDPEKAVKALSAALDEMKPSSITGLNVTLQHVVPLESDYDAVRKSAAAETFATGLAGELRATDFAVLVDGKWLAGRSSEPDDYHAEFGIVRRAELSDRLARWVGRIGIGMGSDPFGGRGWNIEEAPAVALFVDSVWWARPRVDESEIPDRATALVEDARQSAAEMVKGLIRRVHEAPDG